VTYLLIQNSNYTLLLPSCQIWSLMPPTDHLVVCRVSGVLCPDPRHLVILLSPCHTCRFSTSSVAPNPTVAASIYALLSHLTPYSAADSTSSNLSNASYGDCGGSLPLLQEHATRPYLELDESHRPPSYSISCNAILPSVSRSSKRALSFRLSLSKSCVRVTCPSHDIG
jgi:hypothetical protein